MHGVLSQLKEDLSEPREDLVRFRNSIGQSNLDLFGAWSNWRAYSLTHFILVYSHGGKHNTRPRHHVGFRYHAGPFLCQRLRSQRGNKLALRVAFRIPFHPGFGDGFRKPVGVGGRDLQRPDNNPIRRGKLCEGTCDPYRISSPDAEREPGFVVVLCNRGRHITAIAESGHQRKPRTPLT